MYVCCVPGCNDMKSPRHRFPIKDQNVFRIWLERIGNKVLFDKDPKTVFFGHRICHLHFEAICESPGTARLKHGSLPTKFLPSFRTVNVNDWNVRTLNAEPINGVSCQTASEPSDEKEGVPALQKSNDNGNNNGVLLRGEGVREEGRTHAQASFKSRDLPTVSITDTSLVVSAEFFKEVSGQTTSEVSPQTEEVPAQQEPDDRVSWGSSLSVSSQRNTPPSEITQSHQGIYFSKSPSFNEKTVTSNDDLDAGSMRELLLLRVAVAKLQRENDALRVQNSVFSAIIRSLMSKSDN